MKSVLTLCLAASLAHAAGTNLVTAVQDENRAAVMSLLKQKGNVNTQDEDGSTPLAWAALRCNVEIAQLLLKAGANPNLTNEQGIGPLYMAIANGSTEIVRLLLDHHANPNLARE